VRALLAHCFFHFYYLFKKKAQCRLVSRGDQMASMTQDTRNETALFIYSFLFGGGGGLSNICDPQMTVQPQLTD
jgi:hypothetical protein